MRIAFVSLAVFALAFSVAVRPAGAAGTLRLDIVGLDEQPGHITASVAATGTDGKPVPGLTAASFGAQINTAPLTVKDAQPATKAGVPASIYLAVDEGKAMAGANITNERLALGDFITGSDPGDRLALLAYGTRVDVLQDIDAARGAVSGSLAKIASAGDVDLYDAVNEASRRASAQPPGRRIVVIESAGAPVLGLDQRSPSMAAAKASGAVFYVVALGNAFDRAYLTDLANGTGGRLVEVPASTGLRAAYQDLALSIRSQYALSIDVPVAVDRTVPGQLNLQFKLGNDSATASRQLTPLAGALPPTFELKLGGLATGQKLNAPVTLAPAPAAGVNLAKVDYSVDGQPPLNTATAPPFSFAFDPRGLSLGNHILTVIATDAGGRTSRVQVPFIELKPPGPKKAGGSPVTKLALLAIVAVIGLLALRVWRKRRGGGAVSVSRARPWSGRVPSSVHVSKSPDAFAAETPDAEERLQGRVLLVDERPGRMGEPGSVRQFELRSSPLSFGCGSLCDIRVEDVDGEVAAEEARIWVQKQRLVYHKLTTLSAMATEGMVSGWSFLDDGEELHIGPYRLVFRADPNYKDEDDNEAPASVADDNNRGVSAA